MTLAESTLLLTIQDVCSLPNRTAVVLTTNSVKEIVEPIFEFPIVSSPSQIPHDANIVIVVGGGSLIDETKILASEKKFHIVAIPSIWGSGAEVSPVAVFTDNGEKKFQVGDIFRPKYRCIIPNLADSIPTKLVEYGCGDSWSHVIEGGLSPLADDENRKNSAILIQEMLSIGIIKDPLWFDLSARACMIQSESSVGIIHAIAHTLEPILHLDGLVSWGHAKLCSILLWPVYSIFLENSDKWSNFVQEFNIEEKEISFTLQSLFDEEEYKILLNYISQYWSEIIKHPFTRTNSCLVRRNDIGRFMEVLN